MPFQIGKFFDSDKKNNTEAVGGIIFKPWSNNTEGKCLAVVVAVENGYLKGIDTPHCFFCNEREFKKAVKDFSKITIKKSKPVFESFESAHASQEWMIEGMGLSDADAAVVFAELNVKFEDCFEMRTQGKYLKSNLVW